MSDTETLASSPAVETTEQPVTTPAAEELKTATEVGAEAAPEGTAEGADESLIEDSADEGEEPKKRLPGSQKLKRRLQMIEAEFEAERQARTALERQLAERSGQQDGKPGVDREPKESDFPDDYFAFNRAHTAWSARQAVRDEFSRLKESDQQNQSQRLRREVIIERQEAYAELAQSARERIPDFDKVIASASDVKITNDELVEELMASEKSALLQYYLAKNPEKARELNGLRGKELAKEVGRLEARVHLPQAKKATEASPPPSQPKGGAAAPFDPVKADIDSYAAHWKKTVLKR